MLATHPDPVPTLDNAALDNAALTERFRGLELVLRRTEAELAEVISEGQRRSVYVDDSHHSIKAG